MKKIIKKFTSSIGNYLADVRHAKAEQALMIMGLLQDGKISVEAAAPFYLELGGRKTLDEEGRKELEKLEAERGSCLSEKEQTILIMKRGMIELEQKGILDRLNTSFLEREIQRTLSHDKSERNVRDR